MRTILSWVLTSWRDLWQTLDSFHLKSHFDNVIKLSGEELFEIIKKTFWRWISWNALIKHRYKITNLRRIRYPCIICRRSLMLNRNDFCVKLFFGGPSENNLRSLLLVVLLHRNSRDIFQIIFTQNDGSGGVVA